MLWEKFWTFVTYFGDVQFWIGLSLAILLIYPMLSKKDKHKIAWIVFALIPALIVSYAFVFGLKEIFEVARPCFEAIGCPTGYSFPSGHATLIFTFAGVTAFMVRKKSVLIGAFTLAILVAASRVFLNYHTIPDVLAGSVIGLAVSYIFYRSYLPMHKFLEKRKIVP